jgi:hypothetical protein
MQGSSIIRDTAAADPKDQGSIQKIWTKNRLIVKKGTKAQNQDKVKADKPVAKVKRQAKAATSSPSKVQDELQGGLDITEFDVDPDMQWLSILDHAMIYLVKINEAVAAPFDQAICPDHAGSGYASSKSMLFIDVRQRKEASQRIQSALQAVPFGNLSPRFIAASAVRSRLHRYVNTGSDHVNRCSDRSRSGGS